MVKVQWTNSALNRARKQCLVWW